MILPETGMASFAVPEAAVFCAPRSGAGGVFTAAAAGFVFSAGSGVAAEGGVGVGEPAPGAVTTCCVTGVAVATVTSQFLGMCTLLFLARRMGYLPRNPLRDIPVVPALFAAAVTWLVTEGMTMLIENGPLPRGALGLVLVGLTAGVCLAGYLVWTVGPRRIRTMMRTRSLRA